MGFEAKESRSQYAGLVSSRYYTKDGITVRIGDHENSNKWCPSHTRDELWNASVEELKDYVINIMRN